MHHPNIRTALCAAVVLACSAGHAADHFWTSGNFVPGSTAPNPLPHGDQLYLTSNGRKTFDGVAFENQYGSMVRVTGSGGVRLTNGASIVNGGLWNWHNRSGLSQLSGDQTSFTNNGAMTKTADTGSTTIGEGVSFINNGSLIAETGTLRFSSDRTVFNANSSFRGAAVIEVRADATFNGAYHSSNLVLDSGTQTGNAVVMNGSTNWQAGTLQGDWQVGAGQQLTLTSNGAKAVSGAATVLDNRGSLRWSNDGDIALAGGAVLHNNALLQRSGATGSASITAGSGGTLRNDGRILNSGGGGMNIALAGGTLVNNGVIESADGGSITLPSGFINEGGLLAGGAFSIAGSGLVNAGRLAPGADGGAAIGTMTLRTSNSFAQTAAGTLAIDVTSPAAHDLLFAFGSGFGDAALAGTLALNCLGDCSLAVGDVITILHAGRTISGSFDSVVLSGFATGAFEVIYEINAGTADDFVRLRVTEAVTAVPEPGGWAMMLAGAGVLGWLSRRRRQGAAAGAVSP